MKVTILSKRNFDNLMKKNYINDENIEKFINLCLISILDPIEIEYGYHDSHFSREHENVKIMRFGDYINFVEGLSMFTDEQYIELYDFIEKHKNTKYIFVHCSAGISRSGAVGLFINELYNGDWDEFKFINPQIFPNSWVLDKLRKEHLKRII